MIGFLFGVAVGLVIAWQWVPAPKWYTDFVKNLKD